MFENSNKLKTKIEQFSSKFLSKDQIFVFEQNKFDIFLDNVFNVIKITLLPLTKFFLRSIMAIIDRLLNFVTQQKELKKKILKQEEILSQNMRLNSVLSEQISQLNNKIDNITTRNNLNLNKENNEIQSNNLGDKEIINLSNTEIDFYQKENLRISNELYETQKKFEIVKNEIEKFQNQRSNLIEKINSVNDVIQDSNIVTNVFENNNSQDKIHVQDPEKNIKSNNLDLNSEIEKIFQKK
tara:strand:+ start:248 stop:967 length:720 start_codon:yes stop_codon:yes gene_type:complete